jgi:2-C-methyl-D-erythritol 2,4-cyclodiphosphate synthase
VISIRVGWGFDAHRLGGSPPIRLAGVIVDSTLGVKATSDGDVAAHAVADAVLGAAALGDLGELFPSSDPRWEGANSMDLLAQVVASSKDLIELYFCDLTVVAEEVKVAPYRLDIRRALGEVLGLPVESVSVKATTTDGMGLTGRGEGIAAIAVVTAAVKG